MVAIIGDVTTAPTLAVVTEAYADNTPMITASATAEDVTYNADSDTVYTNMFRSCFIDSFQGDTMARFAKEILGAETAAVLYDNGDPYSTGVYEYFLAKCEELGVDVVAVESYASGSVDFSGQLTNIAAAGADVLFLPVYYNDVALIATPGRRCRRDLHPSGRGRLELRDGCRHRFRAGGRRLLLLRLLREGHQRAGGEIPGRLRRGLRLREPAQHV